MRTTLARNTFLLVSAALSFSLAAGCGGAPSGETATGGDAALQYEGPIAATADPGAGQLVFQNMCASCHGPGGAGPDLRTEQMGPAALRRQIREGDEGMPAFPESRINATDLEHLLAHLDTIGVVTGGTAVAGDTSGGEVGADPAAADPATEAGEAPPL